MTPPATASRRALLKGGLFAAVPLAGGVAAADPAVAARLAELEDHAAVASLHGQWLRRINAGDGAGAAAMLAATHRAVPDGLRAIAAAADAEPLLIEVAADRARASARQHCLVETETLLPADCSYARMAHAQGGGRVRQTERHLLAVEFVRTGGGWRMARLALTPA